MKGKRKAILASLAITCAIAAFSWQPATVSADKLNKNTFDSWYPGIKTWNGMTLSEPGDPSYELMQPKDGTIYYTAGDSDNFSLIEINDYFCNYTEIDSYSPDRVLEVYEKYKNAIAFDVVLDGSLSQDLIDHGVTLNPDEPMHMKMYHNAANSTVKRAIIQKFCQELEEKGLVEKASYLCYQLKAHQRNLGLVDIEDFPDADKIIPEIMNQMTFSVPDSWYSERNMARLQWLEEANAYRLTGVSLGELHQIMTEIQKKNPDAAYHFNEIYNATSKDEAVTASSETIDILESGSEFTTGDVNNDENITLADAYHTLIYTSEAAIHMTSAFTDGTDYYKEAAAYAAADVNLDGDIQLKDAYYILMYSSYQSIGAPKTWEEILNAN